MTRAEYLEYVQEGLGFPETGVGSPDASRLLYDTQEVVDALRVAHQRYVNEVAGILGFPDAIQHRVILGMRTVAGREYLHEVYLA